MPTLHIRVLNTLVPKFLEPNKLHDQRHASQTKGLYDQRLLEVFFLFFIFYFLEKQRLGGQYFLESQYLKFNTSYNIAHLWHLWMDLTEIIYS